jgi:hypothetical protein
VEEEPLGEPVRVLPFDVGRVHSGSVRNCAGSSDTEEDVAEVDDEPPGDPRRKLVSDSRHVLFDASSCNVCTGRAFGAVESILLGIAETNIQGTILAKFLA